MNGDIKNPFGGVATGVTVAALTVAGALGGLVLVDVVDGRRTMLVAGVCAVAAAVAATATARRRAAVAVGVSVLGAFAAAVATAALWPGNSERNVAANASDALIHGWATLVTAPVPSAPSPRLLVPVAVIAWAATFGGVAAALRTTSRLVPLVPAIAALVLTSIAAGGYQAAPVTTGLAFVASAAVVTAARGPLPPVSKGRRASLGPVVLTAVAAAGLAAAAAAVAGPALAERRDPFDPREHLDPPSLPADAENPLDLLASRLQRPDEVLFTVRSDEPLTTRLVALDSFDGASWSVGGPWVETGSRVSPPARPEASGRAVSAEISIPATGLTGPFLPSVGDTTRVSGVSPLVELNSGSLALADDTGRAAGADGTTTGRRYTIDASIVSLANLDAQAITSLGVASGPEADRARALPTEPPTELVESAEEAVAGRTTPTDRAAALNDFFRRGGFALAEEPRSGHAYYHLLQTLGVTFEGTSEQYAAAFAVYGRIVGLPTRVVVGFKPGVETEPGLYTVRSGDATVWAEVLFDGVGWIPFDPTPIDRAGASDAEEEASMEIADREIILTPPPTTLPKPTEPVAPPAPSTSAAGSDESGWLTAALAVIGVVVALAAASATAIVVVKRGRTRRRRGASEPRAQVLGAWHDLLDRIAETGGTTPGTRTVEEHVRDHDQPDAPLGAMYLPVVRAAYGHEPLDATDADAAWAVRDQFVRARNRRSGVVGRARCAVALQPVMRPNGSNRRPVEVARAGAK